MMIYYTKKIKVLSAPDDYAQNHIDPIFFGKDYLPKYGFEFTKGNKADLFLVHHNQMNEKMRNKKTIIIERADSTTVNFARKWMDGCLGLIRGSNLNPIDLNNHTMAWNRYHYWLINEVTPHPNPKIHKLEPLTIQQLSKIKCLLPMCLQPHFKKFKNIFTENKRTIDVIYSAHSQDGMATMHRNIAKTASKSLSLNCCMPKGFINRNKWKSLLLKSKICVCPWGFGDMCFRDYDTLYCGCVMIKPYSDFIKSYPSIYENGIYYVACKHDYSDLEEKCNMVLDNWDYYYEMTVRAKNLLNSFWNPDERAKDLANGLKELCE